ncbi:MAG: RNA polymerase sigma factor [Gemmatirosa sp.]
MSAGAAGMRGAACDRPRAAEVARYEMIDVPTDAALVRRVLDGDSDVFAVLVDRHGPACLRFATRMLGHREDAEDATQESLLRAYRALPCYDEREHFRAWLFAILVNRCRTMAAIRGRRERRQGGDLELAVGRGVAPDVAGAELRDDIARAIASLAPHYREAFLLRHVEQWSYDDMARATGVGVSALKMRVMRACERLRELLAEVSDVAGR